MIERFLNSDLFAFLIFSAMIYFTVRLIRHYRYHGSDVKYFRIYSGVHDLEQIVTQLEQLEEIQTSIELAKFHRLKGVTIQLPDNLGQDHDHTLLINGHDKNSKALMQLVLSERDRLRNTLTKKISELDKHGTTQLRPDLVAKELAEVSTMRARGAHFAPLKKKTLVYEDTPKNVKVDLNDYLFLTEDGGEDE